MLDKIKDLFVATFNEVISNVVPVKAHGSDRKLYRLESIDRSIIGVSNPVRDENIAFLTFSRHFRDIGLPVPEIYADDMDQGIYLEEDLGDETLFDRLTKERAKIGGFTEGFPDSVKVFYQNALQNLVRFQIEGGESIDYDVCYPRDHFDYRSMKWDLNYFKYCFLKLAGISFNESELEKDFDNLIKYLLQAERSYFLYRDFQSRNIMIKDDDLFFIDYQGGRRGALQYDLASLLNDGKANIPTDVKHELFEYYFTALNEHLNIDRGIFEEYFNGYVLIRIMQTFGAYGFRGYYEGKSHFLSSIPYAAKNLKYLLNDDNLPVKLPMLNAVFKQIIHNFPSELVHKHDKLKIEILSFSYRNGIPIDKTEHGGGFVFDCRSLDNPGRHDQYKSKTGLDEDVIKFIENVPEAMVFKHNTFELIENAVAIYRSRNFDHLMVCYGCTGGQHRSVYFASMLVDYLKEKYEVIVELRHLGLEELDLI